MEGKLKIKVCGMRQPENIREIGELLPDYMGFIFYPRSKRYAGGLTPADINGLDPSIKLTGVFVDTKPEEILSICRKLNFTAVQLHGTETPDVCKLMMHSGLEVIKAFGIDEETDLEGMRKYLEACDLFLLDTATEGIGGSGLKFNWSRLAEYTFDKPFLLSGGIGPADADDILKLSHANLLGVDLNSRFELEPGLKDPELMKRFIDRIRSGGK